MRVIVAGVGFDEQQNEYYICVLNTDGSAFWLSFADFIDELVSSKRYYFVNVDRDIIRYYTYYAHTEAVLTLDIFKKYIKNGKVINIWGVTNQNGVRIVKDIGEKRLIFIKVNSDKYIVVDYSLKRAVINYNTYDDWRKQYLYYDWGRIPTQAEILQVVREFQILLTKHKERAFALNMSETEFYAYMNKQSKIMNSLNILITKYKWLFIQFGETLSFNLNYDELGMFYFGDNINDIFDVSIIVGTVDKQRISNMSICYSLYPTYTKNYFDLQTNELFVCACEFIVDNDVCNDVKNVYLCQEVRYIFDFNSFTRVSSVDMRNTQIDYIGVGAFSCCHVLKAAYLPKTLTKIPSEMFSSCTGLEYVDLGNVVEIGDTAFGECTELKKVVLSPNLKTVERYAFCSCRSLEEFDFPDSVTSIGACVFMKADSLKHIHLPNSLKCLSYALFSQCTKLEEVNIPSGVLKIDESVFDTCNNLKRVSIYADAKKVQIANGAFSNCDMKSLPKNLINWLKESNYKFD